MLTPYKSGFAAFFLMYDYPSTAAFLTSAEQAVVVSRLEEDRHALDDSFRMQYVLDALRDWKIWVFCVMTVCLFTPLYCFSLFLPTIVKDLGYTNNAAQLMTVPPYVVACVICVTVGFAADRSAQRGVYIIGCCLFA